MNAGVPIMSLLLYAHSSTDIYDVYYKYGEKYDRAINPRHSS